MSSTSRGWWEDAFPDTRSDTSAASPGEQGRQSPQGEQGLAPRVRVCRMGCNVPDSPFCDWCNRAKTELPSGKTEALSGSESLGLILIYSNVILHLPLRLTT